MYGTSYTIGAAISWADEGQGPFLLALFTNVLEGVFSEVPHTLFPAHMYILL